MSEKELQRFCHYEDLMKEARKSAMKKAAKAKALGQTFKLREMSVLSA